jgi:hypothetical protein
MNGVGNAVIADGTHSTPRDGVRRSVMSQLLCRSAYPVCRLRMEVDTGRVWVPRLGDKRRKRNRRC